ncbi:phosphatase PAP2 family protein [Paradesulfitobacterium ferrireducens]|uniref:phosphatase PAP2 family protein n=1 Tax=Paradesulfitobacterium ferrireducens TaxID=2816476 RepID=UPI001A8D1F88|nr:phosphatase PAP2 family protein [Paradesulfitobacterium ferrireducens]
MNQRIAKLGYIFSLPILGIGYGVLNQNDGLVFSVITDIDRLIPFVKYFIIPYLLWVPFLGGMLVYFFYKDYLLYKKQLIMINVGVLLCYLIYLVFPTTVPRPLLPETDFFSNLVKLLYSWDNPYNALPSIHVLTSYSILVGCLELSKRLPRSRMIGIFMTLGILMSIVIILSTLFLKQHTILDGIASIAIVNILNHVLTVTEGKELILWPKKRFLLSMMKSKLPS